MNLTENSIINLAFALGGIMFFVVFTLWAIGALHQ